MVRFPDRLAHRSIARCCSLVSPDEQVAKKFGTIEFIYAEYCFRVDFSRHVLQEQGRQVCFNERDVRRKSGCPLVNIVEGLQIGKFAP